MPTCDPVMSFILQYLWLHCGLPGDTHGSNVTTHTQFDDTQITSAQLGHESCIHLAQSLFPLRLDHVYRLLPIISSIIIILHLGGNHTHLGIA